MTTNDHLRQSSQEVLSLVDLRCTKDEGYAEGYAHIGVCARGGSLAELKAKGRVVVHGHHSPILVIYDGGSVFALDNRCPHMGFPLDRGSVDDGTRLAPAERADHSPLAGAAP